MKRDERGQALVEAVAVLPMLFVAALGVVQCGVVVRDRVATSQAATRAGEAVIEGRDPKIAARAALPSSLAKRVHVRVDDESGRVTVRAATRIAIVDLPIRHVSSVDVDVEAAR